MSIGTAPASSAASSAFPSTLVCWDGHRTPHIFSQSWSLEVQCQRVSKGVLSPPGGLSQCLAGGPFHCVPPTLLLQAHAPVLSLSVSQPSLLTDTSLGQGPPSGRPSPRCVSVVCGLCCMKGNLSCSSGETPAHPWPLEELELEALLMWEINITF